MLHQRSPNLLQQSLILSPHSCRPSHLSKAAVLHAETQQFIQSVHRSVAKPSSLWLEEEYESMDVKDIISDHIMLPRGRYIAILLPQA